MKSDAYLSIMGYEAPGIIGNEKQSIINLAESMNTVHNAGGILVLSMHPYNFVTGKNFYDVSGNIVHEILTGGTAQKRFIHWLNDVIRLDHLLKDKCDHQYAIIFRLFHEQTGNWFWWGNGPTNPEDYKRIYRFLVDYLRQNGVDNFVYAFTPNGDLTGNSEKYLNTYPGDDYVDIFGLDDYDNQGIPGSAKWRQGLVKDLKMVVEIAEKKNKIPALTEFGRAWRDHDNVSSDWFNQVLAAIEGDRQARKIAYMFTWANFGYPDNVFIPTTNMKDKKAKTNFIKFCNDKDIVMLNKIRLLINRHI